MLREVAKAAARLRRVFDHVVAGVGGSRITREFR